MAMWLKKFARTTRNPKDIKFEIGSLLEVSRNYVEATQNQHLLTFDSLRDLLIEAAKCKVSERIQVARKFTRNIPELLNLLNHVHGMVRGRKNKHKILSLRKALDSDIPSQSDFDLSLLSENESSGKN